MNDGGWIIPEPVKDEITNYYTLENIYRVMGLEYPPKPLTRRQRLRGRWLRTKSYLHHLRLALVNDCDRGDW